MDAIFLHSSAANLVGLAISQTLNVQAGSVLTCIL